MAVYVFCRNAQLNLTIFIMPCMCIVMPSLFVNCPTVICSPNMLLSYGRDTSSELWTPVQFSLLKYNLLQYLFSTVFLQTIIFHTIRLILCYSKPVRLTTSLFRWGKVLWLCCAGSTLAPESLLLRRITFRHHQPSTCFLAPPGSIKPWFLSEGKLATVRIIPSSWGSQRTCTSTRIRTHLIILGLASFFSIRYLIAA